MTLEEWAEEEIKLAIEREKEDEVENDDKLFDYASSCYASALKAFKSLCEDGHSGMSIGFTQAILNRLIDLKPLTPIEDKDDEWELSEGWGDTKKHYQNKRLSSLFKTIDEDNNVTYSDNNRICCYNVDCPEHSYHSNFVSRIIYDMYPISIPYFPETHPYKVACQEVLFDSTKIGFDTLAVLNVTTPQGETVKINRFFKENHNAKSNDVWEEISMEEYLTRLNRSEE